MADTHSKVLQIVGVKGPVVPTDISKEIGSDSMLASAILSELVSSNKMRISSLKVGSSPLYYLPGQERQLERFSEKLNEKEKRVYDLLKSRKVIRDSGQDTLTRFALRQIKDFAKPIEVTINNTKELFWRWHASSKEEIEPLIRNEILSQPIPFPKPITQQAPPEKQLRQIESKQPLQIEQKPLLQMEQQALQVKKAIPQQPAQILSTPKLTAPRPEIQQDWSVGQLVEKKPVSQLMENAHAQKSKTFGAPEVESTSVRKPKAFGAREARRASLGKSQKEKGKKVAVE